MKKEIFLTQAIVFIIIVISIVGAFNYDKPSVLSLLNLIMVTALAGLTAVYAYYTQKMAEEMKEQRYDSVRPVIDIELSNEASDLIERGILDRQKVLSHGLRSILVNRGVGPAIDVRSRIRTPFEEFKELQHDYGVISSGEKSGISYHSLNDINGTMFFTVKYRDIHGRMLESKRALAGETGNWKLGRLHITVIRTNDND